MDAFKSYTQDIKQTIIYLIEVIDDAKSNLKLDSDYGDISLDDFTSVNVKLNDLLNMAKYLKLQYDKYIKEDGSNE